MRNHGSKFTTFYHLLIQTFIIMFLDRPTTFISPYGDQGFPKEGTDYTLSCELDDEGLPSPGLHDYTWWRDDQLLNERSQNLTQSLDHTLHDGTYTCAASNIAGMGPISQGYQLWVYCKWYFR